ncbi:hypothetical protein TNCV_4898691 [Trichonephila clavipes]|nr:hypothetical protein TNCV_4898691 [Trichonephila clavipes]
MKLERSGESIHRWVSEKKKRGDIKQIKVDSTSVSPQGTLDVAASIVYDKRRRRHDESRRNKTKDVEEARRKTQKKQDERRRRSKTKDVEEARRKTSKTKDAEEARRKTQKKQDERRRRRKTKDVKEARRKMNKQDERRINKKIRRCRLEDQPIPGGPCGAGRYLQATPIVLLLMLTNALSVLGADAMRKGTTPLKEDVCRDEMTN